MDSTINTLKEQIAQVSRRLYQNGMVNTFEGNVSARTPDGCLITPTRTDKNDLAPSMIVEIGRDGTVLNPQCGKKPSSEWRMHMEAYRVRPDVNAIVHCHSPYATAFAMAGRSIEPKALIEAISLFQEIPLAPYGRPGTDAIAASFSQLLSDHDALLLEAHGVIVVAENLVDAYAYAEAVEKIAFMEVIAAQLGGEKPLPQEEITVLRNSLRQP